MKQDDYKKYIEGFAIKNTQMKSGIFSFYLEENIDHRDSAEDEDIVGRFLMFGFKGEEESLIMGRVTNMDGLHGDWCFQPDERFVASTFHGRVWTASNGPSSTKDLLHIPWEVMFISNVRCIANGKAYAVGGNRSVFRRDAHEQWLRLGEGLAYRTRDNDVGYNKKKEPAPTFEDIDGYSDDDLYVCGEEGELWQFNGSLWRSIALSTNSDFRSICCAGDGYVYVVGLQGAIWRGKDDNWQAIEQGIDDSGFLAVRWFKGKVYISSIYGLYTLEDDELVRLDVPYMALKDYGFMAANDDYLLVAGPFSAASFDGDVWHNLIHEDTGMDQELEIIQQLNAINANNKKKV